MSMSFILQNQFQIRAVYYTPMTKPLGVNVPGSPTSTIPGSASLIVEQKTENPLIALNHGGTGESLTQLPVKVLRELLTCIQGLSEKKIPKSGRKVELIQRILASPYKGSAIQQFRADKDLNEQSTYGQVPLKLFTGFRGALRRAGEEILRSLRQPYSMPAHPEDPLPEGAHHPGDCPDADTPCLMCRVFGFLNQGSLFKNYTPPLVDDPAHKLDMPREVNHVLIRTHSRNVQRPDGNTLNFNQQYFAGEFVTYLQFPKGLPDPVVLGFLFNCLEHCPEVGAAKAWGAGKLFLQSYALERVECTYARAWTGAAYQILPNITVIPLKAEMDHAFQAYTQWITQCGAVSTDKVEGTVIA